MVRFVLPYEIHAYWIMHFWWKFIDTDDQCSTDEIFEYRK